MNVISSETRMMALSYGEEMMIVGRTMWTQSTSVTDRQTDGQTDGRTDRITTTNTVHRIASHGNTVQRIASHGNKKLSYCWETVRRESMPRIAEMDVEITFKCTSRSSKVAPIESQCMISH